jgi:hypothetical protein
LLTKNIFNLKNIKIPKQENVTKILDVYLLSIGLKLKSSKIKKKKDKKIKKKKK